MVKVPCFSTSNGGHISYIGLDGDPLKNVDAFEKVVRCMKESGVGYGSMIHGSYQISSDSSDSFKIRIAIPFSASACRAFIINNARIGAVHITVQAVTMQLPMTLRAATTAA